MKKTIFLALALSGFLYAQCENFKDGTVYCDDTNLMWEDSGFVGDTAATGKQRSWSEAVEYCENSTLAGHSDWRLPNVNELRTILDFTKSGPALKEAFTQRSRGLFWTSTTLSSKKTPQINVNITSPHQIAYVVDFWRGNNQTQNDQNIKSKQKGGRNQHVRCVR